MNAASQYVIDVLANPTAVNIGAMRAALECSTDDNTTTATVDEAVDPATELNASMMSQLGSSSSRSTSTAAVETIRALRSLSVCRGK